MNGKTKIISIILFFLAFIISISCEQKQEKVEKIMEDGVEVVLNHIEPYEIPGEPSTLTLEEKLTIDTENDEIAKLGLSEIWAVNVDSEGNIYLWDMPLTKGDLIFKFDDSGNFLTSFLKRGQGPGEVQSPTTPIITEKDDFIVADYFPRKLVFLSLKGELVRKIPFKSQIEAAYALENGNYFVLESRQTPDGSYRENLMTLYNPELEEIKRLRSQKNINERAAARIKGTLKQGNFILWAIAKGKIYIGDNDREDYEIIVYDYEGNLIRKIRKEYTPVEVTEEFKKKILSEYEQLPTEELRAIGKKVYFPKYMPPYRCIFCDDKGQLLVMTFEKGKSDGEFMYDVFDADGRFVDRVGLGNYGIWDKPIVNQFVVIAKKNLLYCIREKESGYKELVVYKMNWK
jgi:hypothetical protein